MNEGDSRLRRQDTQRIIPIASKRIEYQPVITGSTVALRDYQALQRQCETAEARVDELLRQCRAQQDHIAMQDAKLAAAAQREAGLVAAWKEMQAKARWPERLVAVLALLSNLRGWCQAHAAALVMVASVLVCLVVILHGGR